MARPTEHPLPARAPVAAARGDLRVLALGSGRALGERVARALGVEPSPVEERDFEDGEHKTRPLESVRGTDVYVVESLHGDGELSTGEKLCRLLFLLGTLRDAGAERVTAVVPYLCYSRKERRTKPRDPVTTRYVAALLEAVGTDRVVTLDVHDTAAFQNAFRVPTEHLEARWLFAEHFLSLAEGAEIAVVSPDPGGVRRANRLRDALATRIGGELPLVFLEKRRIAGVVSGEAIVGEVRGRTALVVDDLVSTGTTLVRAARACRVAGAERVLAAATHGLFVGDAGRVLADDALERLLVTDAVPPFRLGPGPARDKLVVLDVAPLLAEAIRRMHGNESLVELVEGEAG